METILEETREKRKENTSVTVHSTKKYEICMQQEISNRKYIHFETLVATHESPANSCATPLTHYRIGRLHMPLQREKERSKRKREYEAHSEIQGAGDTVINITKSTQQRQTNDKDKM